MGLDGVELIMAVEEEFKISITDEEAYQCETPAKLTDLVFARLRKAENDICSSQHGFYIVRKAIMNNFNVKRNEIKPDTKLIDVIGNKSRKKYFKKLVEAVTEGKAIFAPFKRPKWVKVLMLSILSIFFLLVLYKTHYDFALSIIFTCIATLIMIGMTSFLCYEFPDKFKTVKDLIRIVGSLDTGVWKREDVYTKIKELVVEQLSVKEEDVHPDSHFVNDLGMG